MAFNKYFQDELSYLRDLGKEFSQANPKLAPFLADRGNDPDVERLLEGFAFLTGKLREKLDDELPELTHGLISLLWPHYLRPVPSMSVLQFRPLESAVSERKLIPRGAEVDSRPVEGTACRFRTCFDVELFPMDLVKAEPVMTGSGFSLVIGLKVHLGTTLDELGLEKLRIHLHGEPYVSRSLYLWCFRYLDRIVVRSKENKDLRFELGPQSVQPVGFGTEEGLLPYPHNVFMGYRLIQEYFALPEKFLFMDITGLEKTANFTGEQEFEFVFEFSRPMDHQVNIKKDNFRLFCAPIANLFERDADPIRVDHDKMEYLVRPSGKDINHYEIYAIDHVEGWEQGSGRKREFHAFESFRHQPDDSGLAIYYRTRLHPAVVGRGVETYMSFVTTGERRALPKTQTVSIQLTCTNRNLAEKLRVGDICKATGTSPEFASFENIMPVSPSVVPPLKQGLHWQLISNMSLNYISLAQIEALRVLLAAYDFRAYYDRQAERESQLRLDGLVGVQVQPVDLLHKGLPIRGLRTRLDMKEGNFAGEGDMYVLAAVLNEFFSLFASINSSHQLIVKGVEHGEVYEWPPRIGQQPLL